MQKRKRGRPKGSGLGEFSVSKLSLDELRDRFSVTCNTFTSIAEEAGVSRERVRQIYNRHFRKEFGRKSGRTRYKVCTRIRTAVAKGEARPRGPALAAAEAAEREGLLAEPFFVKRGRGVGPSSVLPASRTLKINGVTCSVVRLGCECSCGGGASYYKLASIGRCRYTIALTPVGAFVLPRREVLQAFPSGKSLYIPVKREPSAHGNPRRLDFWSYHERWDLLRSEAPG